MSSQHNSQKRVIATSDSPAAIGPYSQAVVANGLVYTAGQIPVDPSTGKVVEGGIAEQTDQVMKNIQGVLAAAGSSPALVVKCTCFLSNMDDFPAFNTIYGQLFTENPPSRSTVQVAKLPLGVLIEVDCIAIVE